MATMYTIFCAILGETTSFSVVITSNETVDQLKKKIKETKPNRFASVDADELALYRVDISGSWEARREELKKMAADFGQREALDPLDELTDIYPTAPPKQTIHIIVQPPESDGALKLQPTNPELNNFVDALKFFTRTVGKYTVADLRDDSNNTHLHKGVHVVSSPFGNATSSGDDHQTPSFVSVYLEKLDGKRLASEAQLSQLRELPLIFNQATLKDHFKAPGPEEQQISPIELDTYTMRLGLHHQQLNTIRELSSAFKDSHVTVYLVDPALTHDDKAYDKNVAWDPPLLQGTLADRKRLYKFRPRSDFSLAKTTYGPLIMGEIVSDDTGESDRWRMLLEGIAVCRYQNVFRKDRKTITLCLYLNKAYKMERYLVYQDADADTRDVHVLHDLTLDLAEVRQTFLLSKQLFNFRQHLIQIPEKFEDRQKEVGKIQDEIKKIYSTSVTAAKRMSEASRTSQASTRTLDPINEDAVLQASFKAIHVLNHNQKDVAIAIRRSDMRAVVIKRIRTNSSELHILRFLQSCTPRGSNYIIPLLDVVERPPGISTLVMPYYTPILNLKTGLAEEIALQLIRGVDWLHRQLISHSDIKERNLVFDERKNCLFIIDFGLAIKLTSREQKVRGARGTVEHVAPEVGIKSSWENCLEEVLLDEDSIYNPMLADVWAVGDVINQFQKRFRSSTERIRTVVAKVATELQAVVPIKRLPLHQAERRIAAECSMAAAAPGQPDTSHQSQGIHHAVPTVALQA